MRGIVWHGPERMSVEEVEPPEVGPGQVVVRPEATGICGSEIEGYLGRMGNRTPPLVMGHEFAGTVTEVGEGADEGLLGRTVAVNPLSSDGTCGLCRAGLTNLCPNRRLVGIHSPGGFAEYTLAPAANVYPLPDGVDARTGALAEPLANGVHAARLGTAGGHPAENAVVIGAGTIGLMCLQAAVLDGIPTVHAVEPHEGRREQALALGARDNSQEAQWERQVDELVHTVTRWTGNDTRPLEYTVDELEASREEPVLAEVLTTGLTVAGQRSWLNSRLRPRRK